MILSMRIGLILSLGVVIAAAAAGTAQARTDRLDTIASRYAKTPVNVVCQRNNTGIALLDERVIQIAVKTCASIAAGPNGREFVEAFHTLLHEASHFQVPVRGDDYEWKTDCRALRTFKDAVGRFYGIRGDRAKAMYREAWDLSLCKSWASLPTYG